MLDNFFYVFGALLPYFIFGVAGCVIAVHLINQNSKQVWTAGIAHFVVAKARQNPHDRLGRSGFSELWRLELHLFLPSRLWFLVGIRLKAKSLLAVVWLISHYRGAASILTALTVILSRDRLKAKSLLTVVWLIFSRSRHYIFSRRSNCDPS